MSFHIFNYFLYSRFISPVSDVFLASSSPMSFSASFLSSLADTIINWQMQVASPSNEFLWFAIRRRRDAKEASFIQYE